MARIFLDRERDAPVEPGFQLITNEVEFLKTANSGLDLHIQGETLCNWAEVYFRNRGIRTQESFSITRELEIAFPELTSGQISQLLDQLGESARNLKKPLSAENILNVLYPNSLWSEQYSVTHVADWLVWVMENKPSEVVGVLMELLIRNKDTIIEDEARNIYRNGVTAETAQNALENWLGIGNRQDFPMGQEFPVKIPEVLVQKAREKWNFQIIASHGKYFEQLEPIAIPFALKKVGARETYQYYLRNGGELDFHQLALLSSYLNYKEINELRKRLPPLPPGDLPREPEGVAKWYLSEYLPYREWQESFGSPEAHDHILTNAKQFAVWYLENYPKGLSGGPLKKWLSFSRTANLGQNPKVVTLVIVLDGLHSSDARTLFQLIKSYTTRLSTLSEEVAFAPIPTVTQFAKEALFRGVPPDKANQVETIGIVLPENKSPAQKLKSPETGKIYLWRVLEPDHTYHHKNKSENLRQDVLGRLEAEALKIKDLAETIPDEIQLQLIITTDHGRLLAISKRTIPVPSDMESHGRCAWGNSEFGFPENGWIENENVVFLYGKRFGMEFDLAIPLGEESFLTNDDHAGSEAFPHGGLFPEEVIVPWIVFARDVERPKVEISLNGDGRARGSGKLLIRAVNMSDTDLLLEEVILHYRNRSDIGITVGSKLTSRRETSSEQLLDQWPSPADISGMQGSAKITQPNGLTFDYSVSIEIKSKDIYDRGENILEDLF